jgi:pimeloyl-ACP methyl ester carboxylesterase
MYNWRSEFSATSLPLPQHIMLSFEVENTMNIAAPIVTAIDAPNQFVEINGRKLAYRSFGAGKPIVLCTRFRGNMDVWDPAFLDALVENGFQVITFDYSGLGLSTGTATYNPLEMARDACDLMDVLDLRDVVIGGWSLGGLVVQVVVALYPERLSHAVPIGCVPPGPNVKPAEQLFYDTALLSTYSVEAETKLFFEPRSETSRRAAQQSIARIAGRTTNKSVPVPLDFAKSNLGTKPTNPLFPAEPILEALKKTSIPILHVGGDHDIIFPVENWYALNQQFPTLQLLTFPSSGHGPHHQYPVATAQHIATFVRNTSPQVRGNGDFT